VRCRITDIKNREVIHVKTGARLGFVNDFEIETSSATLLGIIIFGRLKCFGLFGREEDIVIRWDEIKVMGEDTILVDCSMKPKKRKKKRFFPFSFGGS
jgi:YlmC/YmxH family sporulation protein